MPTIDQQAIPCEESRENDSATRSVTDCSAACEALDSVRYAHNMSQSTGASYVIVVRDGVLSAVPMAQCDPMDIIVEIVRQHKIALHSNRGQ